jgi:hypothetical protein
MDNETHERNLALLEQLKGGPTLPVERKRDPDVDAGDAERTYRYRCPRCDGKDLWTVTGVPSTYKCTACDHEFVALPGGTTGEEIKFPIMIDPAMPEDEIRFVRPNFTMPLPDGAYNVTIRDVRSIGGPAGTITTDNLDLSTSQHIASSGCAPHAEDDEAYGAGGTEWRYYVAPVDRHGIPIGTTYSARDALEDLRYAAAIRARITSALAAEIGDRATAERLAGVVVKALEGE